MQEVGFGCDAYERVFGNDGAMRTRYRSRLRFARKIWHHENDLIRPEDP